MKINQIKLERLFGQHQIKYELLKATTSTLSRFQLHFSNNNILMFVLLDNDFNLCGIITYCKKDFECEELSLSAIRSAVITSFAELQDAILFASKLTATPVQYSLSYFRLF